MSNRLAPLLVAVLLCAVCAAQDGSAPMRPNALKPGDTIAFVAPSHPRTERQVLAAKEHLEAQGYHVRIASNVYSRHGYLAGTDEERAAGIMAAFADPEVDAVFPVAGGFGSTRILSMLDYDVICSNPKLLIGFSDITGLHLALQKKCNLVTFHSPMSAATFEAPSERSSFANRAFWRLVAADSYDGGFRPFAIESDTLSTPVLTLVPGKAMGRLIGGNLSLIAATMGTPYEIETDGRILFIEDVNEAPYRVDRMLSTMQLAGKLDNLAGAVIGMCTRCGSSSPERESSRDEFSYDDVIEFYFGNRQYPVVTQFPVGHVRDNAAIPVGVLAELDADERRLTILEPPVLLP